MSTNSPSSADRDLLLAYHVGILSAEDEREVERRLADDPALRQLDELWARTAEGSPEDGEHLPAWLLARWPLIREELSELERAAAEAHMQSCSRCVEEVEMARGLAADARVVSAAVEVPSRRPRSPMFGFVTGWAVLATAAVLLLLMTGPFRSPESGPTSELRLPTGVARGGDVDNAPRLRVPARTRSLDLDVGVLYPRGVIESWQSPPGTRYQLMVIGPPPAAPILPYRIALEEFVARPLVRIQPLEGELAAGSYECDALLQASDGTILRLGSFAFVLEIEE